MSIIKIVGLNGSLRQNSYNKAALMEVNNLFQDQIEFEILDLEDIPFFNEDLETVGVPESVIEFNKKLKEADAVLIATPEYNYSITPVLKNALDWASRDKEYPLDNKPTAIMSASLSLLGGIRAQYHLRQICVALNMCVLNEPEICIMSAHKKFDENLVLTDEYTKNAIKSLVSTLIEKINKI